MDHNQLIETIRRAIDAYLDDIVDEDAIDTHDLAENIATAITRAGQPVSSPADTVTDCLLAQAADGDTGAAADFHALRNLRTAAADRFTASARDHARRILRTDDTRTDTP